MADSVARLRSAQSRSDPTRVGRYEILLPIASGGMATVYLARSHGARGFERQVALKITHAHLSDEGEFASLALEEARIAARIHHRNVVDILDVGEDPQGLFLVMEYVEGATLSQLLKAKTRMPTAIGVRVLLDALAGLHAAHELRGEDGALLGVVHRDFSPQNILVGLDGVAQLTDFGIAKAADRAGHTSTGVIKGKVAYMAPEQAIGTPVDRRADVWSAGIVAWELFAGRRLYPNSEGVATLVRLLREPPPRLRTVRPDVAPEIEEVVARALAPRAEERPASAAEFARALAEACVGAGCVADHDAVAEFAKHAAGAKLATRRAQVREVLKLRAQMDALAEQSIEGGTRTTNGALMFTPSLRASRGETTVVESGTATIAGDPAAEMTDTVATEDHVARWRPSRTPYWALLFAAVVGVGVVATRLSARTAGSRHANAPVALTSTPPPLAAAPEPSDTPKPPGTAAIPAAAVDEAPTAPRDSVVVRASTPILSLSINGRIVAFPEPTTSVTLERAPGERTVDTKVVAVAADGQKTSGWLHPSSRSLTLEFAKRASVPPPSHVTRAGLAPSPYGPHAP